MEGVTQGDELCGARLAEIGNGAQEARHEFRALLARFAFLQQQVAEPLLEAVDLVERSVLAQVRQQE
jgi:hypothetical protein